jgi:UDP-N-acetylglucosamine acyltransferase
VTTLIDPSAELDEGVYVGPNVVIGPNVRIGERTRIEGFASIGSPAEHRDHYHDEGPFGVEIGRDCVVREFVTVNAGTWRTTSVGPDSALLRGAHVGHDVLIGEAATISADALLGGHVVVGDGANLGLGAIVRQHLCVGALAMVGMNATVTRDLLPFSLSMGTPARMTGPNVVGVERAGLDAGTIAQLFAAGAADHDHRAFMAAAEAALGPREIRLVSAWAAAIEAKGAG